MNTFLLSLHIFCKKLACHLQITTYNVFTQQINLGSDAAWMQDSLVGETREDGEMLSRQDSMGDGPKRGDSSSNMGQCSTVLILEYADRGTLDKAISTGRFHNRTTGEINLVRFFPSWSHNLGIAVWLARI